MLWDLNESKHLYSLTAGDEIHALVFSPNRYWLCAATASSIIIFDLEKKSKVDELKPEYVEVGKKSREPECISLAWSADGQTLFAGYTDNKVRRMERNPRHWLEANEVLDPCLGCHEQGLRCRLISVGGCESCWNRHDGYERAAVGYRAFTSLFHGHCTTRRSERIQKFPMHGIDHESRTSGLKNRCWKLDTPYGARRMSSPCGIRGRSHPPKIKHTESSSNLYFESNRLILTANPEQR